MSPNNMGVFCCAGGLVLLLKIAAVNHSKSEISYDDYKDLKQLVARHPGLQSQVVEFLSDNKITYEELSKIEAEADLINRGQFKEEFRTDFAKAKLSGAVSVSRRSDMF